MARDTAKNIGEILIALLHDVGKLAVRARLENDMWQASKYIVSILDPALEVLLDNFKKDLESPNSKVAAAHQIAGFNVNDEAERENAEHAPFIRLKSPFSDLKLYNLLEPSDLFQNYKLSASFFPINQLEERPNIPKFDASEPNGTDIYKNLWNSLVSDIKKLRDDDRVSVDSVLRTLEKYCSFVPAWIKAFDEGVDALCDISLYSHAKLTAALVALKSARTKEKPLSLIIARVVGYKNFCLSLSKSAELIDLWGRYIYALSIAKLFAINVVNKLGLSSANVLLDCGFEFAILSTAAKKNIEIIASLEKELNRWLFENGLPLSICFSIVDFGVDEAQNKFGAVWTKAMGNLPSAGQISVKTGDFEPRSFKNACAICSNEIETGRESDICGFCEAIRRVGKLAAKGGEISASDLGNFVLDNLKSGNEVDNAIPTSAFSYALTSGEISEVVKDLVNDVYKEELKVEDDGLPPFVAFAGESAGKGRVAALVIGIDSRDIMFDERVSDQPFSLSKIYVILSCYNAFLNHYSKWIAASFDSDLDGVHPVRFGSKGKRKFIGMLWPDVGLVIVGSWSDVLEFGLDFRKLFRAFVGEELYINQFGISAGFFDAEPNLGWKYLLLKADELFRYAIEPEKARIFLKQEFSERPTPVKVCDSIVFSEQAGSAGGRGVMRTRLGWSEFEKYILPIVAQWRKVALMNPSFSKPLLAQLWGVLNIWRSEGILASVELEKVIGIHKRGAWGELAQLLDMIYSFASKNMDVLHVPLGWVERLDLGG